MDKNIADDLEAAVDYSLSKYQRVCAFCGVLVPGVRYCARCSSFAWD